jgi:subtilisin family serine protease
MKKRRLLVLPLLLILLTIVGLVVPRGNPNPSPASPGKTFSAGRNAPPASSPLSPALQPESQPTADREAAVPPPAGAVEAAFIRRTISSQWIDEPQKLVGRQRVRIVEADFKYRFLRLEEAVTTDLRTGEDHVSLLRSSVADHLVVGLTAGGDLDAARKILEENGYRVRAVEPGYYILAELADFTEPLAQSKAIVQLEALNAFIDFAESDYIVQPCLAPNDPAYASGQMWGLHNPGTSAGSKFDADIDAPEAWQVRTDASGIVVAVTDTGIQYNHGDLRDNMWSDPVSGSHGFDAYDDDDDPMDNDGHGTHCAGTIGAVGNNSKGMTGVAWEVQLMGLRFLGPNGGSTSDGIRVINYARLNGARIISASWGGGGFSQSLFNAIQACQQAGIPFVAAAGNSSTNNDSTPHYPSSYNLPQFQGTDKL